MIVVSNRQYFAGYMYIGVLVHYELVTSSSSLSIPGYSILHVFRDLCTQAKVS